MAKLEATILLHGYLFWDSMQQAGQGSALTSFLRSSLARCCLTAYMATRSSGVALASAASLRWRAASPCLLSISSCEHEVCCSQAAMQLFSQQPCVLSSTCLWHAQNLRRLT